MSPRIELTTPRLTLVAVTLEMIEAELIPSIRVLEKNDFVLSPETIEEGAIMFERRRPPRAP